MINISLQQNNSITIYNALRKNIMWDYIIKKVDTTVYVIFLSIVTLPLLLPLSSPQPCPCFSMISSFHIPFTPSKSRNAKLKQTDVHKTSFLCCFYTT